MIIKTLGVTFRGASAYYVQKSIAPQKQAVCRFSDENFFDENFHQKILPKKNFRRRKMKCWESSETRFPKVSRRSEPFSAVFGRSTSARPYRQRRRKKNHLIEAAPFGRLDQCDERPFKGGSGEALAPQPKTFGSAPPTKTKSFSIFFQNLRKFSKKFAGGGSP